MDERRFMDGVFRCGVVWWGAREKKEIESTSITWSRAMNSWLFSIQFRTCCTYACDNISDGHTKGLIFCKISSDHRIRIRFALQLFDREREISTHSTDSGYWKKKKHLWGCWIATVAVACDMIDVSGQSSNFSQIGFENRLRNKIIGSPPSTVPLSTKVNPKKDRWHEGRGYTSFYSDLKLYQDRSSFPERCEFLWLWFS